MLLPPASELTKNYLGYLLVAYAQCVKQPTSTIGYTHGPSTTMMIISLWERYAGHCHGARATYFAEINPMDPGGAKRQAQGRNVILRRHLARRCSIGGPQGLIDVYERGNAKEKMQITNEWRNPPNKKAKKPRVNKYNCPTKQ